MGLIVLITDFGNSDIYVGIMKGVIKNINPNADIIDLTNDIYSQNIKQAAFLLEKSYHYFPENTVFLSIVDPGVGSNRKAILVKTENYYFIAPDNGILTYVLKNQKIKKIIELTNSNYFLKEISTTFHGRDIFAPVAAYLDINININEFGNELKIEELVHIEKPLFEKINPYSFKAEVLHIDKFGNIITSIDKSNLKIENIELSKLNLEINGMKINKKLNYYSQTDEKVLFVYFGSFSNLEIAIKNSNASNFLNVIVGSIFEINLIN